MDKQGSALDFCTSSFNFSQFFRESGATVTCEACEQFYDLADVYIDGDKAMYCNICWAVHHGEWPSKMSVQELLNETALRRLRQNIDDGAV